MSIIITEDQDYTYKIVSLGDAITCTQRIVKPGRELHGPWIPSEVQHRRKLIKRLPHMTSLECDLCGNVLGMCYEGDLNGSDFLCDGCYGQLQQESK